MTALDPTSAAIAAACDVLTDWGIDFVERARQLQSGDLTGPDALDIDEYEQGRPVLNGKGG